ncbi:MAG TPA: histone deacetylase family protein [Rhizomicrobium sp.]|jgi:acetoin utilization deacetylase AcuC-like enzyme
MKTFYSSTHLGHAPKEEFEGGRLTPAVEVPERVERVKARIEERKLGLVLPPERFGLEPVARVHDAAFVQFLSGAYDEWRKAYWRDTADAIPSSFPLRGLRDRRGGDIESKLGSYCFDTATPITKGTWDASLAGVNVALSAAQAIRDGARAAFALARPPGHHASRDLFGGYCYLNNVAIAAQWLLDQGLRPAILDVDYHHGNGTQAIFYGRGDVLFVSIHADPRFAYPHYLGFADERGEGAGEDANLNLPLPRKTDWSAYAPALDAALRRVEAFGPDVLLVSLGLDTFEGDPICRFKIGTEDYLRMGERLARLGKPTLFVFEGGYNLDALAEITCNVLEGFES